MLHDALTEIADEKNKFDIKLIQYILNQKDLIISELRERIEILTKHVNLLNIHYQTTSNVNNNSYEQCDTAERHDPRLLTSQESSDEQLKPSIGNVSGTISKDDNKVNFGVLPPEHSVKKLEEKNPAQESSSGVGSEQQTWSEVVRK
ncbi:hypothetical protein ANN_10779 [Periplaneta americana]|uniref:Uncharacterized protein n=1 Tax=Periplaneta americana TaxID=6978 RepID=A0ABQ8T4W8_PERAM|nr:hypothetical protein ANN_10779 [Periplaneta americana]